jgi:hypothetical protein
MKKEWETIKAKISYPSMVVHKDRNGKNIIQPIPLCEKSNRHIQCNIKETNKKARSFINQNALLNYGLMTQHFAIMTIMYLSQLP